MYVFRHWKSVLKAFRDASLEILGRQMLLAVLLPSDRGQSLVDCVRKKEQTRGRKVLASWSANPTAKTPFTSHRSSRTAFGRCRPTRVVAFAEQWDTELGPEDNSELELRNFIQGSDFSEFQQHFRSHVIASSRFSLYETSKAREPMICILNFDNGGIDHLICSRSEHRCCSYVARFR